MYKHIKEKHSDEENKVKFDMRISGRFKNPMTRQLDEAIRIQKTPTNALLNSKKEFYGPAIQRKALTN